MDFTQLMDSGYMIPTSVAIGSGEPTDIRCVCDTVEDFKDFFDVTSMDLRYEGLITYEKETKKLKVYKGNETWEDVINDSPGNVEVDLSNYVTLEKLSNYATKLELRLKADKTELHEHSNLETLERLTNKDLEKWNNKSDFSGSYEDLTNKPSIPSKISELENDEGYLTEHQDISGKVDKIEGYSLISDSEIKRLSTIKNYDDTEIKRLIDTKSDFSGSYNDLTDKPDTLTSEDIEEIVDEIVDGIVEEKINEKTIFKTDLVTIANFGGIPAGSDLNGLTALEILSKLLYPYIEPSLYVESTPSGGIYEYGDIKVISNLKVVINKNSEKIKKLEIYNENNLVKKVEDESIENGGTFNYKINVPISTNGAKLTVKITDNLGKSVTANTDEFKYVYPYYHGLCNADEDIDEILIPKLSKYISSKSTKSVIYNTNNQRMVFAYPKSYGTLSKIEDANNFNATSTFKYKEVQIQCLDNTIKEYYVYYNELSTLKNFCMEFFH